MNGYRKIYDIVGLHNDVRSLKQPMAVDTHASKNNIMPVAYDTAIKCNFWPKWRLIIYTIIWLIRISKTIYANNIVYVFIRARRVVNCYCFHHCVVCTILSLLALLIPAKHDALNTRYLFVFFFFSFTKIVVV